MVTSNILSNNWVAHTQSKLRTFNGDTKMSKGCVNSEPKYI